MKELIPSLWLPKYILVYFVSLPLTYNLTPMPPTPISHSKNLVQMVKACMPRLVAACLLIISLAMPARAESGLLLKQFSARYGSVTCMVSPNHFRMDASELRVFLKPPFTHMDMYNMAGKTRFSCPIDDVGKTIDWRNLSAKDKKAGARENVVSKGSDQLQEYKLNRYLINHTYPHKPAKDKVDFWTCKDKDFPQGLETACCKLSGLPTGYGFPVKMYQYEDKTARNGKSYIIHYRLLDTTKVIKKDFPSTTFAEPTGFRPVADMMELMVSSQ